MHISLTPVCRHSNSQMYMYMYTSIRTHIRTYLPLSVSLHKPQVTEVLLRVNDDLNNAFLRYDRLERMLISSAAAARPPANQLPTSTASAAPAVSTVSSQNQPAPPYPDAALIDFGSSEPSAAPPISASALAAHVDNMSLTPTSNIADVKDVPPISSKPGNRAMSYIGHHADCRHYEFS